VKAGRRVAIVGFGAFRPTRRAARKGRNPQTGAPVQIRASKGVSFGASALFKEIVNGKAPLGSPKLTVSPGSAAATPRVLAKAAVAKKTVAKRAPAKAAVAKKAPVRRVATSRVAAKAPRASKAR